MSKATAVNIAKPRPSLRALLAWAFYDWANSPFTTLIITFIFSTYFSQGVVQDQVRGQSLWGVTSSITGITIAVLSPILGAVADVGGRRKPWLAVFTALCVVGSCMLWFAKNDPAYIAWAMTWVVISSLGFEFGVVFNNAMLPDLVDDDTLGRWSGWAWGLGYFGGLAAMVVALFAFIQRDPPLFGLDKTTAEHVRVVGPLCGLWFAAFVWPLFVFTPDKPSTGLPLSTAVRQGVRAVGETLRHLPRYANIARFLVARMIFNDGLTTVFAFGGIFAAGVFGMTMKEVIVFGLALNVTAGVGAAGFGFLDDKLGSKRTILISLVALIVTASIAVAAPTRTVFWIAGACLGIFVGPAQAASRSLMARLAPPDMRTEFFGLFALTGKAIAFLGPLLVSGITESTQSQRWGLATVVVMFVVGFVIMLGVREEPAVMRQQDAPTAPQSH